MGRWHPWTNRRPTLGASSICTAMRWRGRYTLTVVPRPADRRRRADHFRRQDCGGDRGERWHGAAGWPGRPGRRRCGQAVTRKRQRSHSRSRRCCRITPAGASGVCGALSASWPLEVASPALQSRLDGLSCHPFGSPAADRARAAYLLLKFTIAVPHPTPCTQRFCNPGISGAMSVADTIIWAVNDSSLASPAR
jgi:hypothetical protein